MQSKKINELGTNLSPSIYDLTVVGDASTGQLKKITLNQIASLFGSVGGVSSVAMTVPTGLTVTGSPITTSGTLAISLASGYSIPTTSSQTNWDSAYTDRLKWDGGSTGLTASTGRTSLGATTVGSNLFTLTNPSAVTFLRVNADNTISALDAATFRTAIGAGTSSTTGTVTSVAALSIGTTGTNISSTVANGTTTPVITLNIPTASSTNRGALSAADWTTFNSKQASLGTGTSSQFLRGDLVWAAPSVPTLDDLTDVAITSPTNGQLLRWQIDHWENWSLPSFVQTTRTLTINGTTYDLSSDRSWTIVAGVSSVSASSPLASTGGSTPSISIQQATTSQSGYLSSTDWNTFNSKVSNATLSNYLPLTGGTLSGNLTATGFFESSDKRLKKEISDNPIINGISDIKPKLYVKDGKEELGYYAQELEEVLPSAVSEGQDGFLSLSYAQVHTAKIAQLEGEIKELKEIIKTLIK